MLKKVLLGILLVIAAAIATLITIINIRYDRKFDAPYPDIQASTDSAMIARGKYLAYGPAHCSFCHAPMSEFQRVDKGGEAPLKGGFDFKMPFGNMFAPNITPDEETGIGKLTDGQIARALRYGVARDGRAIIDMMPFYDMSDDDLKAVISFLRSQEPIHNPRPKHELNLMGKAVFSFLIKPMGDGDVPPSPAPDSTAAYGAYIANSIANCGGCHTPRDMMTGAYTGPEFSGGNKFEIIDENGNIVKGKHVMTPNITPDKETGRMADWTQQDFIKRFRDGRAIPGTPMPWGPFSRMSDMELIALYKYLQTVAPARSEYTLGIQDGDPF
ncbi:MAG: cytochrome C [Cyclobacteriaceae bacterium]|nr:cytochrome C [Cyclobacteriaceae bacterium]